MSKEGRRIKSLDPMDSVAIYIMPDRDAASNYFLDKLEISRCEEYIKRKRTEGLRGFGMLHVLTAAYVRMLSQRPGLNRYIRGQKRYARNDIEVSMVVKKEMKLNAPETVIKVIFTPLDTAKDVYDKMNILIEQNKKLETENSMDGIAKILAFIPGVCLKFTVWCLKLFDYFGLLPRALTLASPFHASLFITNVASLGINPVYHHLYDFGNLPIFMSMGAKYEKYELNKQGEVETRRYLDMTIVCDERICDGHYYASAFKYFRNILKQPEVLDTPPETVVSDIK